MSCPYRVLRYQYVGTKETCSPLIDPSTLVRKSFMLVREVQLVRQYVGTLVKCGPLIERLYTRTQISHGCRRSGVSTLVRWYTRDMQFFNRTLVRWYASHQFMLVREVQLVRQYVGTLVICSPLIERQYITKQFIHWKSGVSTLVRWYTSDTVSIRTDSTVVLVNTVSTVVLMTKQKTKRNLS